jgi:hypothetical protein
VDLLVGDAIQQIDVRLQRVRHHDLGSGARHDAPTATWSGRTAAELFDYLRTTMPDNNPGRLSGRQYADIVAYLLQLNGMPTGPRSLSADPRQLEQIRIATWSNR